MGSVENVGERSSFARAACLLLALIWAIGCGGATKAPPTADSISRRTTRSGEVIGFVGGYGSHAWLGIPYAEPPVGALRWRAPEPPRSRTGTREALANGSPCVQYASPFGGIDGVSPGTPAGSEDCLHLNVYVPRFAPADVPSGAARLPVMVWIHGGGNSVGTNAFYDGGNLAVTENVVVVAIKYRLGPFGWFRHRALHGAGSSPEDRSGNYGTLDQIRALEWVRDNIDAFGGNPDNVTIFGESAGGRNVYMLLLAPPARGLFQRAIVQSGGLRTADPAAAENFSDDSRHAQSSNDAAVRLLIADGSAADRAGAKTKLVAMDEPALGAYLRGKPAYDLLRAYPLKSETALLEFPQMFRDGTVLPSEEAPRVITAADRYNSVPVMVGTNRDENKLFMFGDPKWVRRVLWILPRLRDEARYNLTAEYLSKMWKAGAVDEPATALARAQEPGVYVYRFDWDEEPNILGADISVMLGAAHAFEVPFVFGHFDLGREGNVIFTEENEPGRKELARQMMSYWAEFARRGDPGRGRSGDLAEWVAWDGADPRFLVFDTKVGGGVRIESGAIDRATVIAAVDADSRLPTQRDKCMIYRELAEDGRGLTKEEYLAAGKKGCADYPFEAYPWD